MYIMKNILYIMIVLLLSNILNSCSDNFLDVDNPNALSSNVFWKTQQDAELALVGAYNDWETWSNIIMFDAISDNAYYSGMENMVDGSGTPSSISTSYWMDGWRGDWWEYIRVQKYNRFLENIGNVQMSEELKAEYSAEVRFLRAYRYFMKVMIYGDVPLITQSLPSDAQPKRDPANKVIEFILKELEEVSKILPVENQIQSMGHVTAGAALALKARLELIIGDYDNAMKDAKAVIDMGVYELNSDFRDLFIHSDDKKEVILDINYTQLAPTRYSQFLSPGFEGGYANMSPTLSLLQFYSMENGLSITDPASGYDPGHPFENRDPRLKMSILVPGEKFGGKIYNPLESVITDDNGNLINNVDYYTGSLGSPGGLIPKKLIEPMNVTEMQNNGNNIIVIRLAEVYLTFAECALATGENIDLGLEYLNKVRVRAGMPPAPELTMEIVRYERRVEFALENLRFYDIKRWDLGPEVLNGPVNGVRQGSVDHNTGEVTWDSEYIIMSHRNFVPERNYLFPIPQDAINSNPNLVQSPGY